MDIPERAARTGSGSATAGAARSRADSSKSQQCHRTGGCLGRLAVRASPVGSAQGYGNRSFPQVRRTGLRLDRADAGQSDHPKHPPPGRLPPGLPAPRMAQRRNHQHAAVEAPPRRACLMSRWLPPRDGKPERQQHIVQSVGDAEGARGWGNRQTNGGRTRDSTHDPMGTPLLERRTAMPVKRSTGAAPATPGSSPMAKRKPLLDRRARAAEAGVERTTTSRIRRAEPRKARDERQTRARRVGNRAAQRLATI